MASDRPRSWHDVVSSAKGAHAMRTCHSVLIALVLLASGATAGAQTQITTAVIEGVVQDPSGAALPGVDIEIRNAATNLTRNVITDREGRFAALQLPSG